ncbi:replicative DNA helicase [bacterium]|nr:replicative DNA helicase [bacterium]
MAEKNSDRLPPQNIEAEKTVLGSILIDADAFIKVADILTARDFYDDKHRIIYETMEKMFEKSTPIDLVTLTEELRRKKKAKKVGAAYLSELASFVPSSAHIEEHAKIVADKAALRRLISAASQIIEDSFKAEEDAAGVLDKAERSIFSVSEKHRRSDFVSLHDALAETYERLERLHEEKSGGVRGLPTGFSELDNMLSGLQPSDLIILAARPAMGKTSFALNIALNIALKAEIPVGIFSLEMSKDQLIERLLCMDAQIDSWKMRTGKLSDEDFSRLGESMGRLSEAPIFIEDTPNMTVSEIRAKARRLQAEHKIGFLVIDYLQLMQGERGSYNEANRVQEISEISRGLKALARELDVPLLALSQLSRAVEQRHPQIPQLSDLRESGSLEQDADVVMFIYREDYYDKDTDRKNIADILIRKHRHGPTGEVELYFVADQLLFREVDKRHEVEIPADEIEI